MLVLGNTMIKFYTPGFHIINIKRDVGITVYSCYSIRLFSYTFGGGIHVRGIGSIAQFHTIHYCTKRSNGQHCVHDFVNINLCRIALFGFFFRIVLAGMRLVFLKRLSLQRLASQR